jgi:hypothetical protein
MPDNSFESFMREHRADFEERGPSPGLWAALEQQLPAPRKVGLVRQLGQHWLKVAVMLVLIINTFFGYRYLQFKEHQQIGFIAPELQEAKAYYTTQIEQKLSAIKAYPPESIGLDSAARKELELHNSTYEMLEKELQNNPGNERIRAALVRYYQLKLDLLEKILEELDDKHAPKKLRDHDVQI